MSHKKTNWKLLNSQENIYANTHTRQIKIKDKQLLLKVGPYPIQEPDINMQYLTAVQLDKLLNDSFIQSRRKCYLCGEDKKLGICIGTRNNTEYNSDWYNPFEPTKGNNTTNTVIPAYMCTTCRRHAQCGSTDADPDGYHPGFADKVVVPSQESRGSDFIAIYVVNKFESYNISSRFIVVTSEQEAMDCEINLFQQLDPENELHALKVKDPEKFHAKLAKCIRSTIPALIRSTYKDKSKEMGIFEPNYEHSLIFVRCALHILKTYDPVCSLLKQELKSWSGDWMDMLWIAALCGVKYEDIKETLSVRLMEEINNSTFTYNQQNELLSIIAFTNTICAEINNLGVDKFVELLDDNKCYLPESYLMKIWQEIKYTDGCVGDVNGLLNYLDIKCIFI
jgi:hypothetical protein